MRGMTPIRSLHPLRILRRPVIIGLLAPAALAFSAAQARAAGDSIAMVQNDPSAVAGHATNFTASGALNPQDTMFGFDVYIFVKDPDADSTCAADFETESAAASFNPHEAWVSPPGGFQVGTGSTFNQPFKVTFTGGGRYLLCGYVQSDFSTVARGELRGTVAATNHTQLAPGITHAPWITRRGHVLVCHSGTWSNSPNSLRYRWYVKGSAKSIGSGRTLAIRRSLKRRSVRCQVTAANAAGARTASTRSIIVH